MNVCLNINWCEWKATRWDGELKAGRLCCLRLELPPSNSVSVLCPASLWDATNSTPPSGDDMRFRNGAHSLSGIMGMSWFLYDLTSEQVQIIKVDGGQQVVAKYLHFSLQSLQNLIPHHSNCTFHCCCNHCYIQRHSLGIFRHCCNQGYNDPATKATYRFHDSFKCQPDHPGAIWVYGKNGLPRWRRQWAVVWLYCDYCICSLKYRCGFFC